MKILLPCIFLLFFMHCGTPGVEHIITQRGGVFEFDGMRLELPETSIAESTIIEIKVKSIGRKKYEQGFSLLGQSFSINPVAVSFEKPAVFSMPTENDSVLLAAKIGKGFIPIAGSKVEGETLRAKIWHGGEYYIIRMPGRYGIIDHADTKEALLIVSDLYVGDYIKNFKLALRQGGYNLPIWTFVYPHENSVEDNALFLLKELKELHNQYGEFRLDVVSFGIGGLITHRYLVDSILYQKDVSSAVIAIGTPFFGSNFANRDNVNKGKSPFRFFFLDGLGEKAKDLTPGSDFIMSLSKKKGIPSGYYYDKTEENKNFASLRGNKHFAGEFPEEYEGDGLVSLSATLLTPIEPEPFDLDHFNLFEDNKMHNIINDFIQLYRSFNWPLVFMNVWRGEEKFAKISEIWEKEVKLIYRKMINIEVLLEYNENMLKSAPKNAILITNGDNDTYPAWYLQEKGIRRDVLVVNRSLLNLKENVRFLQKNGLPLDITHEQLEKMKHKKEDGELVTMSDQLIELLLVQNKRPVVFATTVYNPHRYGYPLKLSGIVYEIGEGDVNIRRTKALLHDTLSFDKLFSTPMDSLSIHIQNLSKNYAATAFQLSMALGLTEGNEEALQELEFAMHFSDEPVFYYNQAKAYMDIGKKDAADSIFKILLGIPSVDIEIEKEIAQAYYDGGMREEAIKVLAQCLQTHPDDHEIPELIKKYQEGK